MKKELLRKKLTDLKIPFTESDTIKVLQGKLSQSETRALARPDSLPFIMMETEDENQIVREIQGEMLKAYVYSFESGGQTVVGLSKAGVDQCCHEFADKGEIIRVESVDIKETADAFQCTAKATRFKVYFDEHQSVTKEQQLDSNFGFSSQPKKMKTKHGMVDDVFAGQKALAKSQRNAKKSLLPYGFIQELIKKYVNDRKGVHVVTIKADDKINDGQLRLIHARGKAANLDHVKINEIAKAEWGIESLAQLQISQLGRLLELIDEKKEKALPALPLDLIGISNEQGMMKGERDVLWAKSLTESGGNVGAASEFFKKELARSARK